MSFLNITPQGLDLLTQEAKRLLGSSHITCELKTKILDNEHLNSAVIQGSDKLCFLLDYQLYGRGSDYSPSIDVMSTINFELFGLLPECSHKMLDRPYYVPNLFFSQMSFGFIESVWRISVYYLEFSRL